MDEGLIKKEQSSAIILPAVTPSEAVKAWKEYQELKKAIVEDDDVQKAKDGKKFLKKSYWRKVKTFFNLSVDVIDEKTEKIGDEIVYHFICKAIHPNGSYAIGSGSCSTMEKGYKNTIHNTRATAETRAFNRAVSNLVGGGEVSAEEVFGLDDELKPEKEIDPETIYNPNKVYNWIKKEEEKGKPLKEVSTEYLKKYSQFAKGDIKKIIDTELERRQKEKSESKEKENKFVIEVNKLLQKIPVEEERNQILNHFLGAYGVENLSEITERKIQVSFYTELKESIQAWGEN